MLQWRIVRCLMLFIVTASGVSVRPTGLPNELTGCADFFLPANSIHQDVITGPATLLNHRALPNAPSGYTPRSDTCPSPRPSIRSAATLSPSETSWLEGRRNKTVDPMRDFLRRMNISGFDAASYISDNAKNASALPNIAIAVSGGGYRALMSGGKPEHFPAADKVGDYCCRLTGELQTQVAPFKLLTVESPMQPQEVTWEDCSRLRPMLPDYQAGGGYWGVSTSITLHPYRTC